MARSELNTADIKIEQKPNIPGNVDLSTRESEVIHVERDLDKDFAEELAFAEEPVTIRIEPSSEKNAPTAYPVWVNGKGAEIFANGRWYEIAYLPVGRVLTLKRKYVAVMAGAKYDAVETYVKDPESERPDNQIRRFTSASLTFSVIEDRNPRGASWLTELRRRNM